MLNNRVPDASARAGNHGDDWLNAGVEEVPADLYKQQDDEWLNAGTGQPLGNVDESWLNPAISERPEIQIKQDGSILNVTVTAARKPDIETGQAVINLKINLPPQYSARKGEGPYDIEITTDDGFPEDESLQDFITVKPGEEMFDQSHLLMDEISIRPAENLAALSYALMDEVTVRPADSQLNVSTQLWDEITVKPVEIQTGRYALMDEVTVRAIESPVTVSAQLMDEITVRASESQAAGSRALMDEVTIKPCPGPVDIEYQLLDDLITKRVFYRAPKEKPSSDAVIDAPAEIQAETAETAKTVSLNEISDILNERRVHKRAAIPQAAGKLRITPLLTGMGEGMGSAARRTKSLYQENGLRGVVTKALAALRIYNKAGFYVQDTDLTRADTPAEKPQIKDFTFKVLSLPAELDELISDGYVFGMDIRKIKRGLKKGMVAFAVLEGKELASMGWACMNEESKAVFRGYPYNDDLDKQACIVGDWTNPKYQDGGYLDYVKYRRQMLLEEKGFKVERSIVDEGTAKNLCAEGEPKGFESNCKRRTYTIVSIPGILGLEFWKEYLLDETDTKPQYRMITLLILVLPFSPIAARVFHSGTK